MFCMRNPMKATRCLVVIGNINKVYSHIFHLRLSGENKHIKYLSILAVALVTNTFMAGLTELSLIFMHQLFIR